jgi:hypothetical protein
MITLDFFKKLLDVDITDTENDDLLQFILDSAVRFVTQETGVLFSETERTETILGDDDVCLFLQNRPLNNIVSVTEYYTSGNEGVDITDEIGIDDNQFSIIYRKNGIFYVQYKYVIKYNTGYAGDAIPKDLEYCVYQIGLKLFGLSDNIKNGVSKVTLADGTSTIIDYSLLPDAIMTILNNYRVKF